MSGYDPSVFFACNTTPSADLDGASVSRPLRYAGKGRPPASVDTLEVGHYQDDVLLCIVNHDEDPEDDPSGLAGDAVAAVHLTPEAGLRVAVSLAWRAARAWMYRFGNRRPHQQPQESGRSAEQEWAAYEDSRRLREIEDNLRRYHGKELSAAAVLFEVSRSLGQIPPYRPDPPLAGSPPSPGFTEPLQSVEDNLVGDD